MINIKFLFKLTIFIICFFTAIYFLSKPKENFITYTEPTPQTKQVTTQPEPPKVIFNPEIVNKELSRKGKIIVYEGTVEYKDVVVDETLFSSRQMNINLKYKYGIGMDLSKIKVANFYGDTYNGELMVLEIPKDGLQLEYVELINPGVNSSESWFATKYKPEDYDTVLEKARLVTIAKIKNDKRIYVDSMKSLKENVKGLVQKLGYGKVMFEEV